MNRQGDQKERVRSFFDSSEAWKGELYTFPESDRFAHAVRRRKSYAAEMLGLVPIPGGGKALDVGCGCGIYFDHLLQLGLQTFGLDLSLEMLGTCRKQYNSDGPSSQVNLICSDVELTPLKSATFDVVLCIGVLGYLLSDDGALQELRRVLKPGGYLLLNVENMMSLSNIDYVMRRTLHSLLRRESVPHGPNFRSGYSMSSPWVSKHSRTHYQYRVFNPWKFESAISAFGFRRVDSMTFGFEFRLIRKTGIAPESLMTRVEIALERLFRRTRVPYFVYSGESYTGLFQRREN